MVRQAVSTASSWELTSVTLGTLKVHVLGDSIVPRTILNSLHIVCASLRQIHLSILLLASIYLPFRIPFISPLSPLECFDIFIVDQLSVCVPILRWFGQTRVVFYCHFPDKLLAGGREVEVDNVGRSDMNPREAKKRVPKKGQGLLKRLYRLPFDKMEEATTGKAIRCSCTRKLELSFRLCPVNPQVNPISC
jgi:alpha-1,3/alpha-1,6-mannosyltransferase